MRKIMILFPLIFCFFSHGIYADETSGKKAEQLVGLWNEYSPSTNYVNFSQDGTLQLLLKKGEIGDLHVLDGVWSITEKSDLQITMSMNGKVFYSKSARLVFRDQEMIMIDENGVETKHRRREGKAPSEYNW
jgi:hypothetical protein